MKWIPAIFLVISSMVSCRFQGTVEPAVTRPGCDSLAGILERSLIRYTLEPWYPRSMDTIHGGYLPGMNNDWSPVKEEQGKALVQQARHLWATSYIAGRYPGMKGYAGYAAHGFRFISNHLRDPEQGGFFFACNTDGSPDEGTIRTKNAYGQAFTIMALAEYYRSSGDRDALELAMQTFRWMEQRCHDPVNGGYFEILERDGRPRFMDPGDLPGAGELPSVGLKDYNSSIHILEALTTLFEVAQDSLIRKRLEEMFILVRDTIVHPDGYEHLYFYPDWSLVPEAEMERRSPGNYWYTQHVSFCHDVEVAFLLLEAAKVLGMENDGETRAIAKKMIDHSLDRGWDDEAGGFLYAGRYVNGTMVIIDDQKPWWGQSEGLNALVMMFDLFPDDPRDYYGKTLLLWEYIDHYLIDQKHGGWYNFGTDHTPGTVKSRKSHWWKASYHTIRGMDHTIATLRQ